jgi:MFS transporter, FSR family, fosmidomycin resistance protein
MIKKHIVLLSLSHVVMDVNQGALPALLPFLISDHHLSYAAAAGVIFAANISSSLVQPLFGYFADRLSKTWLITAGLLVGGAGLALTGVAPGYWSLFMIVALGGFGIAAYHPEAARLANLVAGADKATGMSFFATGGYLGFAIGPILTTALLLAFGLKGTLLLFLPVLLMSLIFAAKRSEFTEYLQRAREEKGRVSGERRQDAWGPFVRLGLAILSRATVFYALNTFIPLYWIYELHQSKTSGGTALTVFFTAGVLGSLVGGRAADRLGYRRVILSALIALALFLPALAVSKTPLMATLLLAPTGFLLFSSFSPMVVLGQHYLPNHVAFASGVTLGLAITVGGIAAPVLGRIADIYGLRAALMAIMLLPVLTAGLVFTLPEPVAVRERGR